MGKYTLNGDWGDDHADSSFEEEGLNDFSKASSENRESLALSRSSTLTRFSSSADQQTNSTTPEVTDGDGESRHTEMTQRPENSAPIHYHIYYSDDDSNSSSFSSYTWILLSLVAVVAHICYWYGPSVPPILEDYEELQESITWQTFLQKEVHRLGTLLSRWIGIAQYVCFWCWKAISYDLSAYIPLSSAIDPSIASTGCQLPTAWWDPNLPVSLNDEIIGQSLAVEKVHRLLNKWKQDGPLIFYVIGGAAVGKRHLAHAIANQFVGPNCRTDDSETASSRVLLQLNPSLPSPIELKTDQLFEQVFSHVTANIGGSVILWPGVDDSAGDKVVPILEKVTSATDVFANSIFVLTSRIGTPTLNKALRKYGRTNIPILELESFLMYEVVQAHNKGHFSEDANKNSDNPFSKVHVLHMLPLDREAMRKLLNNQLLKEMSRIQENSAGKVLVDTTAMDYLLNHGIEWETWIHKKTNQHLLEFSPSGGKALDPLMARVTSSDCQLLKHRRPEHTLKASDERKPTIRLKLLSSDLGKFAIITCPMEDQEVTNDSICTTACEFVL